jgi:hypothetical protein
MNNEIWKDVAEYEGLYIVSNTGRIKSLFRYKKELKPKTEQNGYNRVQLFKNKKGKWLSVHRIVAEAFCDKPEGCDIVNHKDENKLNNNANNLEWCTAKYNNSYGTRLKRMVTNTDYTKRQINNKNQIKACSKPITQYTKEGSFLQSWNSASECSRATGITISNIRRVCNGERKTAGGFIFKEE